MSVDLLPLACFVPILVLTAWSDLSRMTISNRLVGIGLLLLLPFGFVLDPGEVVARLAVAGGVFALCLAAFAAHLLGGGDAKILPVLFLCVPSGWVAEYLLLFAASLFVALVGLAAARRAFGSPDAQLMALRDDAAFPMGLPIALSGLLLLLLPALLPA